MRIKPVQGVYKKTTKDERGEDKKFLAWLRTLHCDICGKYTPYQAAHIRLNGVGGIAQKPVFSAIPCCGGCHAIQHSKSHLAFGDVDFWLSLKEKYLKLWNKKRLLNKE
jgi:hypothetical protein